MEKQWIRTPLNNSYNNYTFWVNGKKIGDMIIKFSQTSHRAICKIDGKEFEIKRVGRWKANFEMSYLNAQDILTAITDESYGNTFNLLFENKKYKLIIRNNPLVEYVITE